LWKALDVWQTADFLPSHMTFLMDVLDSFWGPLILTVVGILFIYRAVASRWPEIREREVQAVTSTPIGENLRQRCCKLSTELFEFYRHQQEHRDRAMQSDYMISRLNDPAGGREYTEESARQNRGIMDKYREQLGHKVLALTRDLVQGKHITPRDQDRFENPEKPQDIQYIAQRLAALCGRSDSFSQEYRRQRIEAWRSAIRAFDFSAGRFTSTETYSQMRPHLDPDVKRKLEHPGMVVLGNATRGEHAHSYMLSDEVSRIEKEWRLV
jgi:hypothetical protein